MTETLRVEYRKAETLIPFARNPRSHSDAQVAKLAASIVEFGWTTPVLVDGSQGIGNHYLDAAAYTHLYTLVNSSWIGNPPGELTVWFAADSGAGWWWLHATEVDTTSPTGLIMRFACAGTTSRRYPSDRYQGVCSRYGVWDPWGDWEQAYAIDETGALNVAPWTGTWSPFGEGWTNNGQRHPCSPLPKMAVPQFPNRDGGSTAVVLGEFNEIMILTDGYAQGEIVVPGWIAMRGDADEQPYAVPAPASFTVL